MTNKTVKLFTDLVRIDSPSGNEGGVRELTLSILKKLGFECFVDKTGNAIAKNNKAGEPVLVGAHFDTVEPGRGIKPQIKNGIITSDGKTILGADNKAALASILSALSSVPKDKIRPLEIVLTVREETDGGINYLNFKQLKSKLGVIADSILPIGALITGAPWIEDIEINIKGKAAHASRPQDAINALVAGAWAIANFKWGHRNKDTIANAGIISGGDATNTIPGWLNIKGEIRSFSNEKFEIAKNEIENHFKSVAKKYKAKVKITHKFYGNGYSLDKNSKAIEEVLKVYKIIKIKPNIQRSFGASDANIYAQNGIDVANIGDGVIGAHTTKEQISVASLMKLTKFFETYFVLN